MHCALFDLLRLRRSLRGMRPGSTLGAGVQTFAMIARSCSARGRDRAADTGAVLAVRGRDAPWRGCSVSREPGAASRVKVVRDIEPLTRQLPIVRCRASIGADCARCSGRRSRSALMGAVEAIAIGKTLAARAGHPFDASRQLVGEGLCNLGAGMVGGFASSGSFSRTAVNFEAGAVTRMSCILSGVLVLVLVLVFAPQANMIPIAALAGTLVHVGFKLVDVGRLRACSPRHGDRVVLLDDVRGSAVRRAPRERALRRHRRSGSTTRCGAPKASSCAAAEAGRRQPARSRRRPGRTSSAGEVDVTC